MLDSVPPARRMWSLVSIGRFSRRFVSRWLAGRYNAGDIGYEEIFLPTICAAAAGCRLAEFGRGAGTLLQLRCKQRGIWPVRPRRQDRPARRPRQ